MSVRAHDAGVLDLAFDDVDAADEIERDTDLGVLALLEELATRVCKTARAGALSRRGDRVVAGVAVDDETSLRLAEHGARDFAAASWSVAVDDELGRDEVPDEGALVQAELLDARLVGVHVGGLLNERERSSVKRRKLASRAMEQ